MDAMRKSEFVLRLFEFYKANTSNPKGIKDMYYAANIGLRTEYVYVDFGGGFKRFSVWGDNEHGILCDFANFLTCLDAYEWLDPEDVE